MHSLVLTVAMFAVMCFLSTSGYIVRTFKDATFKHSSESADWCGNGFEIDSARLIMWPLEKETQKGRTIMEAKGRDGRKGK